MAKSKRKRGPKVLQHTLRFDSRGLLDAVARYAKDRRQSRNAALLTLIEASLRRHGYYEGAARAGDE